MGAVVAISIHNNNINVKTYYIHWAQKLLRYWNSVLFDIISFYYIKNGNIISLSLSLSLSYTHTLHFGSQEIRAQFVSFFPPFCSGPPLAAALGGQGVGLEALTHSPQAA